MNILKKFLLLTFFTWSIGFFIFLHSAYNFTIDYKTSTDAVVIFGASKQRLYAGSQLVKLGYSPMIFIVADKPAMEYVPFLIEQGLSPSQIVTNSEADSLKDYGTETALFLKEHNFQTIRLVAPSYQIKRAEVEVETKLPGEIIVIPYPVSLKRPDYYLLLAEYNKLLLSIFARFFGLYNEISLSYP